MWQNRFGLHYNEVGLSSHSPMSGDEYPSWLAELENAPDGEPSTVYYPNNHLDEGEDLENYTKRGFYPAELGQIYGSTIQYRIIHKLGHGGSSNIWLGQDTKTGRLHALKVLSDYASSHSRELQKTLQWNRLSSLSQHIIQVQDHFQITGPNGKHTVIVFEVLGPSIADLSLYHRRLHPETVQELMLKTAQAVKALHAHGIVHRDLHPGNVVLKLNPGLQNLSAEAFNTLYGPPARSKVTRMDGSDPAPRAPCYTYRDINFTQAVDEVELEPVLIDFGESTKRLIRRMRSIPPSYAAPEALLENRVALSCDVWSLGCLIYRARSGQDLFPGGIMGCGNSEKVLYHMVATLGLPPATHPHWRTATFDDDDQVIVTPPQRLRSQVNASRTTTESDWMTRMDSTEFRSLRHHIEHIQDRPHGIISNKIFWGNGRRDILMNEPERDGPHITSVEADLLHDLLSRMFIWHPEERISADEVVSHPWFQYNITRQTTIVVETCEFISGS